MLCNIIMCGRLGEVFREHFRFLEFDRLLMSGRTPIVDKIPIASWDLSKDSFLFKMKTGALVIVSGRLQREEEIGLYVVSESLHYLGERNLKEI